jgi:MerR family transcriptional regulator, redox-sensitive transcriptional activator SoxR
VQGMSIGEVARRAGLRTSAIRYYEKLGLLPKPSRVGGRRRYDDRVLERLAMVRFAKHVGFSIAEAKLLLDGVEGRPPTERWKKLAREKAAQVDEFIAQAGVVRKMLQETLDHKCPKLVERGRALPSRQPAPRFAVSRRRSRR